MTSHPIIIYRQGGGGGGRGYLLLNLPSPPLGLCRLSYSYDPLLTGSQLTDPPPFPLRKRTSGNLPRILHSPSLGDK